MCEGGDYKNNTRSPTFLELFQNDAEGACVLFFLATVCTITLEGIIHVGALVLWADLLHDNPNRTFINALIMPFVLGPLEGIWLIMDMLVALLVAPLVVYLAARRFEHFPDFILLALIPTCVLLVYAQDNVIPNLTWYTDTPETDAMKYGPFGRIVGFTGVLISAFLVAWWIVRRSIQRTGKQKNIPS